MRVATLRLPSLLVIGALILPALTVSQAQAQVAGAIVVYPTVSSLEYTSTKQFSAYVPISPNAVTWLVNDVVGGNAAIGTISASGLYTPPTVIPAKNIVTIKAKSTAYPSSFGTAKLTITRKYPWLWSVSPSALPTGAYTVSFNGSNFAADSKAMANGVALSTTFVSATRLVATGVAAQAGTIQFAVKQPAPGAVTGNAVTVNVTAVTARFRRSERKPSARVDAALHHWAVAAERRWVACDRRKRPRDSDLHAGNSSPGRPGTDRMDLCHLPWSHATKRKLGVLRVADGNAAGTARPVGQEPARLQPGGRANRGTGSGQRGGLPDEPPSNAT